MQVVFWPRARCAMPEALADLVGRAAPGSDDMEIHTKTYDPPLQKKDGQLPTRSP